MMTRPKTLDLFGLFLVGVAISFPIQIMVIYGHGPTEWFAVAEKLTFLNWLVMASALLNALLVWRASPALKYTVPLMIGLVAGNNWIVAHWHVDYSPTQAWTASLLFVGLHGVLFRKPILHLIVHPEKRWWLRPPRKIVEVSAYVSPFNGTAFKAKTFDISENGAFIPFSTDEILKGTKGDQRRARNKKIGVDDRVTLCLTLGLAQIRCDARIVRTTDAKGIYPAGIGLTFDKLPRQQRRELRRYIEATA